MKRYTSVVLVFCLLMLCFVGCGEKSVTPTDINTKTEAIQTIEEADKPTEKVEPQATDTVEETNEPTEKVEPQATDTVEETNEPIDKAKIKQDTNTENKKDMVDSTEAIIKDNGLYTMPVRDYPTFTSVEKLQQWLVQGDGQYTEERAKMVAKTKGQDNAFVYYKPATDFSAFATFEYVEIIANRAGNYYYYCFNDSIEQDPDFIIISTYANADDVARQHYEVLKQRCLDGESNENRSFRFNGIDYYCQVPIDPNHVSFDTTHVYWQQFGLTHSARIQGHFDQIEQIIPLLKLEKVTLQADAVTE